MVFLQRFGGSLNLNPHVHALVLDGVYERGVGMNDAVCFAPLPAQRFSLIIALRSKILLLRNAFVFRIFRLRNYLNLNRI
ncbi:MAG: transposase [Planctomycetota bacterium]